MRSNTVFNIGELSRWQRRERKAATAGPHRHLVFFSAELDITTLGQRFTDIQQFSSGDRNLTRLLARNRKLYAAHQLHL